MVLPSLHEDAVVRGFLAFLSHSQVIKQGNAQEKNTLFVLSTGGY